MYALKTLVSIPGLFLTILLLSVMYLAYVATVGGQVENAEVWKLKYRNGSTETKVAFLGLSKYLFLPFWLSPNFWL